MTLQMLATAFGGPEVLRPTQVDVPQAGPGQVTIDVRAAGVNPTDWKGFSGRMNSDPSTLPLPVGYEVAGVVADLGADTELGSGGGAVGDAVLAFRIRGGYADRVTVPAKDVFAKPDALDFAEAANLLLVGTTAAQMLDVTAVGEGDTVLVHGASGATGVSVLQQARLLGARVIGTCSPANDDVVRRFGGEPVAYGDGLEQRVRQLAPGGIAAALDCVGTDEAVDVSLALVADRHRIVTIAAFARAPQAGIQAISGSQPDSQAWRDANRRRLIGLAASGDLVVPMARTFPLAEAAEALELLKSEHPGGKLALIP